MWHFVILAALLPISPRLDVRFPNNRPFQLQWDEFPVEWHSVYTSALQPEEVEVGSPGALAALDDFWQWAIGHACPAPLRLASEERPFQLLVCALKCRADEVPVIKFERNGTRVRECVKNVNV